MPALNGYREEGRMGAWCKIGGSLPSLRWFRSPFRLLVRFSSSSGESEMGGPSNQLHLDLQSEDATHPDWTGPTGGFNAGGGTLLHELEKSGSFPDFLCYAVA